MLIKIKKKKLDRTNRLLISNTELKRRYYKFMRLVSINSFDKTSYIYFQKKLMELPKNRYNNSCFLTNRGRGVLRKFRMSRHQIKEKFKYLHGLINSSW